jgi:nitrogen fixation/metabolism regulation signal transduction histidine kinase
VSGGTFRQHGLPQRLLVLTDVSRALREEERQAWQRLIRVLGHELNNSLAPIRSLADSLGQLVARQPRPSDWEDDMRRGLAVIAGRSESLSRFLEAYGRLARLPAPQPQRVDLGPLLRRVAGLEQRVPVAVRDGPAVEVQADPVQLEQVVINLLRNAAEASSMRPTAAWSSAGKRPRAAGRSRSGSTTAERASPTPGTCSCRSSRPSPRDRASASSSAARSRRRTAARSSSRTGVRGPGCRARLRLPLGEH